ncbi:amino acid ABC transporter substrate-binding protein [Vibrio cholerae]|nr:amino acid ABC transporter substrate-binding protein [Vibrio cholerae]
MNYFIRQSWLFFFTVTSSFHVSATTTLRLAYSDIESYPFQMGNGESVANPPGLALDVLNDVATKLELKIEYVRLPGKRVLNYIDTGKVDGGFIFSYNTLRAQYARYPMQDDSPDSQKRIATIGYYFYTLQDQKLDWDGEKILNTEQQVGAHLGFSIVNELKKKQLNVQEVTTTEQLFQMLQLGRLPVVAVQDTTAQQFLSSKKIKNITKVEPAITTKDYYLVFSHQFYDANAEIAEQIWREIGALREEAHSKHGGKYLE